MAEEARNRLGRGLAALMGEVRAEPVVDRGPRLPRRLPLALLAPNPNNPRKTFDDAGLADLAASIKERGVVQPLIVRPLSGLAGERGSDRYEIIAGERRWRAAQKAGLHDVPVIVCEASDKESLEIAIIENVQRADLNALEEARGYQQLIDLYRYSQQELADVIGKSRPHIANTLRLLVLPEQVQALIADGVLSAGHGRALLAFSNPLQMALQAVAEGMSVRQLEAFEEGTAPKRHRAATKAKREKDADTRMLEKSLTDLLGLQVEIDHRGTSGELKIRYKTLEQLDDVCRRLRG
jgi:ParB family transcriptional regulator, chromosome partitioning protein